MARHAGDAVTDGTMYLWKGFVSLILGAYFEKRMAWYPVVRPLLLIWHACAGPSKLTAGFWACAGAPEAAAQHPRACKSDLSSQPDSAALPDVPCDVI